MVRDRDKIKGWVKKVFCYMRRGPTQMQPRALDSSDAAFCYMRRGPTQMQPHALDKGRKQTDAVAGLCGSSCVRPSVCLSQVGVLLDRPNTESRKQRDTTARDYSGAFRGRTSW